MLAYAREGRSHLTAGYHLELYLLGNLLHVYLERQTVERKCEPLLIEVEFNQIDRVANANI